MSNNVGTFKQLGCVAMPQLGQCSNCKRSFADIDRHRSENQVCKRQASSESFFQLGLPQQEGKAGGDDAGPMDINDDFFYNYDDAEGQQQEYDNNDVQRNDEGEEVVIYTVNSDIYLVEIYCY